MRRRFWRAVAKYSAKRADMWLRDVSPSVAAGSGEWPERPVTTTTMSNVGKVTWTYR